MPPMSMEAALTLFVLMVVSQAPSLIAAIVAYLKSRSNGTAIEEVRKTAASTHKIVDGLSVIREKNQAAVDQSVADRHPDDQQAAVTASASAKIVTDRETERLKEKADDAPPDERLGPRPPLGGRESYGPPPKP